MTVYIQKEQETSLISANIIAMFSVFLLYWKSYLDENHIENSYSERTRDSSPNQIAICFLYLVFHKIKFGKLDKEDYGVGLLNYHINPGFSLANIDSDEK